MKKLFTILLVSCLAINISSAQVEQGTWLLGATTDATSAGWSEVQLEPTIGYFLTDQFVLGMQLGFSNTTWEDFAPDGTVIDGSSSVNNLTIGPWVRAYLNERFFMHAGVTITSGSTKVDYSSSTGIDDVKNTNSGFALAAGPGMSLMWGDYIAFEPAMLIQMASSSVKPDGADKIKGPTTINVGFQIGVAVMIGY